MLHWRELIKNVDQKDIEEYGVFREAPDSDKNHRLNGVVVSKKTTKSYNIVCMMDTQTFQENTSMKVFCNCEDFAFRRAYVLHKYDALLAPQNFILTPPKKTNPNEIVSTCKHIKVFLEKAHDHSLARLNMVKGQI